MNLLRLFFLLEDARAQHRMYAGHITYISTILSLQGSLKDIIRKRKVRKKECASVELRIYNIEYTYRMRNAYHDCLLKKHGR